MMSLLNANLASPGMAADLITRFRSAKPQRVLGTKAGANRAAARCFETMNGRSFCSYDWNALSWCPCDFANSPASTYAAVIANADPCPPVKEMQNAASPMSATRPRDQLGISI